MKKAFFVLLLLASQAFSTEDAATEKNCPFSGMAANGTEWFLKHGERRPCLKNATSAGARACSVVVFPITSMADLLYHGYHYISEKEKFLFAEDKVARAFHKEKWERNAENLKRSYLGLLTAPTGLIYPDLVTQHFIPKKVEAYIVSPYGKLYSVKAYEVFPETIEEVQKIILNARSQGKKVSVLGAGMSQGKQALPKDDWNIVINTSKLKKIEIYAENKRVKVQAGATWADLQREAHRYGLAVRVMQASNIFSVGGSLSVNCHGWDHKTGSIRNTISSITIVSPTGDLLNLTPNDELFDFVIGGYGSFGVIIDAEISLVENSQLLEIGEEISPSAYAEYFNENICDDETVDMHLYRLSLNPKKLFETGVAVSYLHTDVEGGGELVDEPERGERMDRIKLHTIRRLKWLRKLGWEMEKKKALKSKIVSRNEIMRPPINVIFNNSQIDTEWLQEYFVKGENLAEFLLFLSKVLEKNGVALFNASVRFVKQDSKTKLSYAKDCDRFAVVLFFNQKLTPPEIEKTKRWVRDVIDYLVVHEGTYYLPYQHFASLAQFQSCYPQWGEVVSKKNEVDADRLFESGLYTDYFHPLEKSTFRSVFKSRAKREQIRLFLSHVLVQLDEDKLFALVDDILTNPRLDDHEITEQLFRKIHLAKPNKLGQFKGILKALSSIKSDLSGQVKTLLEEVSIQGYVEIGYTGRLVNPLKKKLLLKGPVYVVNDKEKLSDYLEIGGLRNYDQFIPLNDYEPLAIPNESVDLVSCYIGLHHIPQAKIDPFLESIYRVLRPGGSFILMDHDAKTEDLQVVATLAHTLFNAATGVSIEEERKELRNFQSLANWIEITEKQGFQVSLQEPLLREGDSTRNSLIRFKKPALPILEIVTSLKKDPCYIRPAHQTYMTAPEWQNVRVAEEYAAFIEKHPSYHFPYFKKISGFWKVFFHSWKAARQEHSFREVLFSEYMGMDLFVGSMMSLELGLKGAFSYIFGNFPHFEKISLAEHERIQSLKAYAAFIEHTPFYQYHYFSDIGRYWKAYSQSLSLNFRTIKDALVGFSLTLENTIKGMASAPFRWLYGSGDLKEAEKIGLLVLDPDNKIPFDEHMRLVKTYSENYKHIEISRYMHFKEILIQLSELNIEIVNIAGNRKIQVDAYATKIPYSGSQAMYEIPADEETIIAYDVEVSSLSGFLRAMQDKVVYIHDY